ncbi:hypothetical protein O1611_g1248 [Lasiodiplodia mahajangana]|uniref:Uncharacterized protein n=1 Tax=Lasiodiplodia mahajangana TaxID=1108764 RepID=A0ACC2JY27_9PEZI|nr:hypothetical protein O1611_g1248 [Lasiodiplodia mahajangana]
MTKRRDMQREPSEHLPRGERENWLRPMPYAAPTVPHGNAARGAVPLRDLLLRSLPDPVDSRGCAALRQRDKVVLLMTAPY